MVRQKAPPAVQIVSPRVRWRLVDVQGREVQIVCGHDRPRGLEAPDPPAAPPWKRPDTTGPSRLTDVDETDRERRGSRGVEGALVGSGSVGHLSCAVCKRTPHKHSKVTPSATVPERSGSRSLSSSAPRADQSRRPLGRPQGLACLCGRSVPEAFCNSVTCTSQHDLVHQQLRRWAVTVIRANRTLDRTRACFTVASPTIASMFRRLQEVQCLFPR